MKKTFQSKALASIHETMEALYGIGAIDPGTMRRFDAACLTSASLRRAEPRKREKLQGRP